MIRKNMLAAVAAWAAIAATGAHAQTSVKNATEKPCVTEQEAGAFVVLMLPGMVRGVTRMCTKMLPKDAYLLTSGKALAARFEAAAEKSKPLADRAIARMSGAGDDEVIAGGASALAPMGELMLASAGKKLDVAGCGKINRALQLIDPLPAENLSELIAMLIDLGLSSDKGKDKDAPFAICKPSR
ncbi:hypothetical protein DMC47_29465 [Nostoc sp. 3335mG]|jgi:hypothetical protein|nr:hypothetical protein DMC47_29465 [Nostoc sp. 3335mG]